MKGVAVVRERFESDKRLGYLAATIALLGIALLPWGLNSFWQSLLVDTLLFILLALGLNVVVGFAGLLDLGFVAFYAIGHYAVALPTAGEYSRGLLLRIGKGLPDFPTWEPWHWALLFGAIVIAMVTGVILGGPTLRLRGDYLAIVTLGFGEIVRLSARNFDSITVGSRGITKIPHPELFGFEFGIDWQGYYYLLLLMTVVMIIAIRRLDNSRIGRAWHAIREDEVAAAAMGVPTVRMKLWAFAIGASTAGIAGAVQASRIAFVSPDGFLLLTSILILAMVVIGGMGNIWGSIAGAAIITILPEVIRRQSQEFQNYRFLIFGAALVLMMIYRPQGMIPSRRRAIELRGGVREGTVFEAQQSSQILAEPDGAASTAMRERGGDDGSP